MLFMNKAPTHTVVSTTAFQRKAKTLGVSETELQSIYDVYAMDPEFGEVEPKTGGLRKGRIAKDGTGKSGGYRVFSFFADEDNPVFLFWMIDKSEDDSLTNEQKNVFKVAIAALKKELRK